MADLLPVLKPEYNLREITKQMVLLEDHLAHVRKRCPDCIFKHLITIEALAEEMITLDKTGVFHPLGEDCAESARRWFTALRNGVPPQVVMQFIRAYRKKLMPSASRVRVASRWLSTSS